MKPLLLFLLLLIVGCGDPASPSGPTLRVVNNSSHSVVVFQYQASILVANIALNPGTACLKLGSLGAPPRIWDTDVQLWYQDQLVGKTGVFQADQQDGWELNVSATESVSFHASAPCQ